MKGITALWVGYCMLCLAFTTWHAARWTARMLSWRALLLRADLAWASKALAGWWAGRARRRGDVEGAAGAYAWGAGRAAWLLGSGCVGSAAVAGICRRYPRSQASGLGDYQAPVHVLGVTRAEVRAFAICQIGVDDVLVTRRESVAVHRAMATLLLEAAGVDVVHVLVRRTRLAEATIRRALRRLHASRELVVPVIAPAERSGLATYADSRAAERPAILDPELAPPPSTKREPALNNEQDETRAMDQGMLKTLASVGAPEAAGRGGAS